MLFINVKAFESSIAQITSQQGITSVIKFFIVSIWFIVGVVLGFIFWILLQKIKNQINVISYSLLSIVLVLIGYGSITGILNKVSMLFLGAFLSLVVAEVIDYKRFNSIIEKTYFIIIILALCVSISLGYPYPVFVAGGIILLNH